MSFGVCMQKRSACQAVTSDHWSKGCEMLACAVQRAYRAGGGKTAILPSGALCILPMTRFVKPRQIDPNVLVHDEWYDRHADDDGVPFCDTLLYDHINQLHDYGQLKVLRSPQAVTSSDQVR
jgi:hypothetical protein